MPCVWVAMVKWLPSWLFVDFHQLELGSLNGSTEANVIPQLSWEYLAMISYVPRLDVLPWDR